MIYLDAAATSFEKPVSVSERMLWALRHCASVGRGGYAPAMLAAEEVYRCRELAGRLFDCAPERVVFTVNATHALNLAIKTLVRPGDRVVISGFEHNAVIRPLHALGARVSVAGTKLFDPEDTLRAFEKAVTSDTAAVVCTHVSNVFGYILPVEKIAALCRKRGVPFILDASQSAGTLPVRLRALGAAFIAMPGHKGLYGPQGTGLLLCGQTPAPLLEGGTGSLSGEAEMPAFLPDRAEAGTHNVCGICGLSAGLEFLEKRGIGSVLAHEVRLKNLAAGYLSKIPGIRLFFSEAHQSGVLSFTAEGQDCEQLAGRLAEQGICVRAGLHCAPLAHKSAGTGQSGTVRVSVSVFNTPTQLERLAEAVKKPVPE